MRPRLVFLTLLLALVPFHRAAAQGGFVNVTATVVDPSGVTYAGCRGTIDFVTPANATAQPTLYRGLFPKNFSISQCDSFEKFSITLAATDQIDCGLGSLGCGQWHFSITSQDGKTGFSVALSIGSGNPNQTTNEDISTLLQAAAAPLPISSLSQFLSLNNNWTGLNSYSKQITSTVSTGTAPFSIASTTVVPNLNAQLTAPASAIVGISDTQTLTNKTLTSPAISTPTLDGVQAGHVVSQTSAATNFGTGLSAQTITSNVPFTGPVWMLLSVLQSTVGVGCSASTNTVSVNLVSYTAPGGSALTFNPNSNLSISGNGAADSGDNGSGVANFNNTTSIVIKAGSVLTYTTTSTLGSTGCTTTPQYTIFAKAFF